MSATTNHDAGSCGHAFDPAHRDRAKAYASIHFGAYLEASDEVRDVIDAMARICADPGADPEDREAALDTLTDALHPFLASDGDFGAEFEVVKCLPADGTDAGAVEASMAQEEATFAGRLAALMEKAGVTQAQLAERAGVGQSAVSMILARDCRPQRRTILRFAKALDVRPDELWPGFEHPQAA